MGDEPSLAERIELHRRMALAYYGAYQGRDVQDGQTYAEWRFAPEAVYWSPYFGTEEIELATHPVSVQQSATMEAVAYGVRFTDWGPASFECWPAEDGFAMKTRFEGHTRDGVLMGFFAYGFVRTDDQGRIVRWETHVSRDYDDFLDVAIGVHGPFQGKADDYLAALSRTLAEAGISLPKMSRLVQSPQHSATVNAITVALRRARGC